jgi:hypothetical protein
MRAATARRMKARGEAMLAAELVAGTVELLDAVELVLDALEELVLLVVLPDVVALLAPVVAVLDEAELVTVDPEEVEAPEDVEDATELEPELERAGPPVIRNRTE